MSRIEEGRQDLLAWDAARPRNFYLADANLERVIALRAGRERLAAERPALLETGAVAANEVARYGREANLDENLPRLERYDGLGVRTEEVVFHPSYHAAGRLIWKSGVLARYQEPGQEVIQQALNYLFAENAEVGHLCPLACTAGLIRVVRLLGSAEQKARWLPGLLATDYDQRIHASQFLTEIQGGSDVGSNAVVARRDGEGWRIHGEKWFCSVADAQVFLMTARPEGAPDGTKGLGLFVVPRLIDGAPNEFRIRRLKTKLGTRAMASGEMDFDGARAEAVGPVDKGFKTVVEHVLDTSRVYNAVCCAASMRRAYVEAAGYAAHRRAFGQKIGAFPLVQETLATMRAEYLAATAATFRLLEQGDRLITGRGDEALLAARRVGVNVNKYWTSVRNTQMVRMALEILGGNGAIETFSVVPQLYRDAMVLESWEGTHNTLVQQVLRDAQRLRLHEPFLAEMERAIERAALREGDRPLRERARVGLAALRGPLARAAAGEVDQRFGRRLVDQMAALQGVVAMLEELAAWPDDQVKRAAVRLIAERDLRPELNPPPALDPALWSEG